MKGISKNKKSKNCWWPPGYQQRQHKIVLADLQRLRCNVVTSVDRERLKIVSMKPIPIEETPHYQYAIGNKEVYEKYLLNLKHITWARAAINEEHLDVQFMFDKFDAILNSELLYLDSPHEEKYIICNMNQLIIDGVHRSISLLANNIYQAPVALVRW